MAIVSSSSSITDALSDLTISNEEEKSVLPGAVELTRSLSSDYIQYLKVDVGAEKSQLEENIEDMLTKLDEFSGLIDMVRSDDSLCLSRMLPEIHDKVQDCEKLFERIDKLEAFVAMVKGTVEAMEEKVIEAEHHLEANSVKKLLTSLQKPLFQKKSPQYKRQIKYEPPDIYSTNDYFKASEETAATRDSNHS